MYAREQQISWGTYRDQMGNHCNAHNNNLVVLPMGSDNGHLLSPLDYDMAFQKSSFFEGDEKWSDTLESEKTSFKLALSEYPELSTGVTATSSLSPEFQQLKWALRDTLLRGFNSGFTDEKDLHPRIPEIDDVLYSYINLALIFTETEVA